MKAIVISAPGQIGLETVPDPSPAPDEVVLEVESVGICGTDLHVAHGDYVAEYPCIPGHEFAGRVVEVGSNVQGLAVGDGVTADPNIYCGHCRRCLSGRENLCVNAVGIGVTRWGASAEYVSVPAINCVNVPDHLLQDASLVEPLSCALHGLDVLGSVERRNVLIYGAGPMGLMLLALTRRAGAAYVGLVDLNRKRLAAARQLGAAGTAVSAEQLAPDEFDVVIDCTGVPAVIEAAIEAVAPGGTFLQFGVTPADRTVALRPERILMQEITITGARAVKRSFQRAAEMYQGGILDPTLMITHRMPLTSYEEALEAMRLGTGIKVQIQPRLPPWAAA